MPDPGPITGLLNPDGVNPYVAQNADGSLSPSKTPSYPGSTFAKIPASSSVVTTSTPANTYVNNLGNNIANGQANPPITPTSSNPSGAPAVAAAPATYTWYDGTTNATPDPYGFGTPGYNAGNDPRVASAANDANSIYTNRETQLKAERDAEVAALTAKQAVDTANLQQTQTAETGTTNRNLAYLQEGGQSASAQAYLNSLDVSHQKEMNNLTAQYNSAIQMANNAFNDKDFALAEAMTTNAKNIKDQALKRNQDFLDYSLKLTTENNNTARTNYQIQKDARDFAVAQGIKAPFYTIDGQTIINSSTGQIVTPDQYKQSSQSGDGTDIQVAETTRKYAPGVIGEWQAYNEEMAKTGVAPIPLHAFVDMRKPTSTTNIYNSGAFSTAEINNVQKIIDSKPGDGGWGDAAKAIDSKFGPGASTRYDNLLKVNFQLPDDARSAAKAMPSSVSVSQWNQARQKFIQDHSYADPDVAGKEFDKTVPKPSSSAANIDLNSTINSAISGQ